ncbi:MAG: penicillin-binding protein activator LpoB [Bacteroidales bacterium]|nr:penicillin-binding protein activator LpoB [Bacteroidales bacterium]
MDAKIRLISLSLIFSSLFAVAQKPVIVEEKQISENSKDATSLKLKVAIGRFSNETEYGKGLFYDKKNDPMAKQALDLLSAKLGATKKFILLERSDLQQILEEANRNGTSAQQAIGADYMIIGSITEFGRKTTGQNKVFTSSKTQTVDATVSIRIIDVLTGQIIFSDEGKGTAEVTSKSTFVGTGGQAGYDATLSDKAIGAAIDQLVENIYNKLKDKKWRSFILSNDEDGIIIAGGTSQGLKPGMDLVLKTKGKEVKNPQTGINITLPGKEVAQLKVLSCGGETPEAEYSFVEVTSGTINPDLFADYIVEEK